MEGYITVCKDNHSDGLDFWDTIMTMIRCLLNEHYMVKVAYEERGLGIIRIEYGFDEVELGGATLEWLLPDDKEKLMLMNKSEE